MIDRIIASVIVAAGFAVGAVFNFVVPITNDNMRWHLAVTGLAAVAIGVGISRLWQAKVRRGE